MYLPFFLSALGKEKLAGLAMPILGGVGASHMLYKANDKATKGPNYKQVYKSLTKADPLTAK